MKRGDFVPHLIEALEELGVPSTPAEVRAQLLRNHPVYRNKPHLINATSYGLATAAGVVRIEQGLYALSRWTFQTEASEIRPAAEVVLEALCNLGRPVRLVELADECVFVWPELENYQGLRRFMDKGIKEAGDAVVRVKGSLVAAREYQQVPIRESDIEIRPRYGRWSPGWSLTENPPPPPRINPLTMTSPEFERRGRTWGLTRAEQLRHLDTFGLFIAGELAAGEGHKWSLVEWSARLHQHLGNLFQQGVVGLWVDQNRDRLPHSRTKQDLRAPTAKMVAATRR